MQRPTDRYHVQRDLNRVLPSNFSPQRSGNSMEEEAGVEEMKGMVGIWRTRPFKSTEQSSYGPTET